jgi:hypothetical protein
MRCPKCGYKIPIKKIAAEIGRKGGSVSSEAKSKAATAREKRKKNKSMETSDLDKGGKS